MTRLRTPSLKVRQNAESQDDSNFKTPTTSTRGTPARTQRKNTPLSTPKPAGKPRGRGRPKGSTTKKSVGKGQKNRVNPWDDDGLELHYGYQSHSDDDDNDEDYEDTSGTSRLPLNADFDSMDVDDEPQMPCNESKSDEAESYVICPWVEINESELPPLVLPESSCDIPLLREHVMEMIEIYEILRSYHRTLRLSPFSFEDFCSAMSSPENSCLLSEIHIALLKMCIRCDDEEQVHYSVIDTNNAFNIMIQSIDCMTYAEIIRQYLEADPSTERVPPEIMAAISSDNYPYVSINTRANVILFLCYRFLTSPDFRKIVNLGGKFQSEDTCRICSKAGDLLPCSNCDAAFHLQCTDDGHVEQKGTSPWICQLCRLNEAKGVTDCIPLDHVSDRQPFRMEPLGYDRHGRIYWFVTRRIIIQDQNETTLHYYSTAPQLYELVSRLDPHHLEYNLCKRLCERIQEILEQMALTLELTGEHRDFLIQDCQVKKKVPPPKAYLHLDNVNRMSEIIRRLSKTASEDNKTGVTGYVPLPDRMEPMLGIADGHLTNHFWAGLKEESYLLHHSPAVLDSTQLFIMGNFSVDENFKKYRNNFTLHDFGDPPVIRKKLLDRKKYLSTKFSLQEEGDGAFQWSTARGRDMYGGERQHTKYVEWTLAKMAKKIPEEMMHRMWPSVQESFKSNLANADTYRKLADVLLSMEPNIRRTMFNPPFWGSLGHTKLTRTTVEDREQQSKEVQRRKKEEREISLAEDDDDNFIKVKYTGLPSRSCSQGLWRQKDEIYRLGGKGDLGGWLWISRTFARRNEPAPEAPPIGLFDDEVKNKSHSSPSVKKAYRLHSLLEKFDLWRNQAELKQQRKYNCDCYSPVCRQGLSPGYVCSSTSNLVQSCYGSTCASSRTITVDYDLCDSTMNAVHLENPNRKATPRNDEPTTNEPWPLQKPNEFTLKRTGATSILMIPKPILRRMSRQGGRKPIYVPNFSYTAKSNFSMWNYPCQRPCFDLCWRWLVTNARSLQAIALQLKILWYCIKWSELEHTEDETTDGRVIVHLSDRDDVRHIIDHKELPPYGTYERYLIEIEGVMLDEEPDAADVEWNDRKRNARTSTRVKRPRTLANRKTQKRQEWIDGVELRVFEIKKYWRDFAALQIERKKAELPVFSRSLVQKQIAYTNENSVKPVAWNNRVQIVKPQQGLVRSVAPAPMLVTERKKPPVLTTRAEVIYRDGKYQELSQKRPITQTAGYSHQDYPATKSMRFSDNSPRYIKVQSPTRRTAHGYEFTGGLIRGGGRVEPVGDGMRRVVTAPTQVAAEEVVSSGPRQEMYSTNGDDKPPIIPRYDQNEQHEGLPSTRTVQMRQVIPTQRSGVPMANGAGKLLVIRRPDGTTQFLRPLVTGSEAQGSSGSTVRAVAGSDGHHTAASSVGPAPVRRIVSTIRGGRPGAVIRSDGSKVLRIGSPGQQQYMHTMLPSNSRVVQPRGVVASSAYESQDEPMIRRIPMQKMAMANVNPSSSRGGVQRMQVREAPYVSDPSVDEYIQMGERGIRPPGRPPARVVQSYGYRVPMQRAVMPRGGSTMDMGQRISQASQFQNNTYNDYPDDYVDEEDELRTNVLPPGVRRVTSYKEFCMKRGIVDNMRLPSRPYRFEFESNEDEERAIAEAIAREEEIMRQEEETKREQRGERNWNHPRIIDRYGEVGLNPLLTQFSTKQPLTFNSNLMPTKSDTTDQKCIKQILDTLISQVCRWDKQFGWYKSHLKRPRNRADLDRIKTRRMFSNQREVMLAEHVDRLRKEINKRRTKLENISEEECGLLTPWRKSRGRTQRAVRRVVTPEQPQRMVKVVNPAEISLGGTDWMENDTKMDEKEELVEDTGPDYDPVPKRHLSSEQWKKTHQATISSLPDSIELDQSIYGQALPDDFVEGGMRYAVPDGMDPQALHCVCQQTYNPSKFYIACDLCSGWFHGECVHVTEESSRMLNGWLCPGCDEEQKNMGEMNQPGNQLYCICRRPYDDTLFYVGCDSCEGWFHPECVGITQTQAESMEQYVCPRCRQDDDYESNDEDDMQAVEESVLCRADYPLVWRVLDQINESEHSWPFKQQPIADDDYKQDDAQIDLPAIQGRLENLEYQRLSDFVGDVNLLIENARAKYEKTSAEYDCVENLDKLFQQGLMEIQNEMDERRRQERRKASESRTIDSTLDIDTDQLIDINLDVDPSMYKQLL